MPRTRAKPEPTPPSAAPPAPAPTTEVLTLAEAAAYLRLLEVDVIELVHSQDLPGRLAGGQWRFLRSAIQEWLSQPPPKYSKEAQRSVAGLLSDDPDLLHGLEPGSGQK